MALPASGAEAAFVGIVLAVAGDAVGGRAGESLIHMAIGALGFGMTVQQGESRLGMVEARSLPAALVVAVGALCAEISLVLVILAVAGKAVGRRRAMFCSCAMAAHAGCASMLAPQRKVRPRMVECLFGKDDGLRIASLVLGMAGPALTFLDTAVVTGAGSNVARHLLVAIKAEPRLRAAVQAYMAVLAFGLEPGMSLYDLAGHDGGFEALRAGRVGACRQDSDRDNNRNPNKPPSTREQPRHG